MRETFNRGRNFFERVFASFKPFGGTRSASNVATGDSFAIATRIYTSDYGKLFIIGIFQGNMNFLGILRTSRRLLKLMHAC